MSFVRNSLLVCFSLFDDAWLGVCSAEDRRPDCRGRKTKRPFFEKKGSAVVVHADGPQLQKWSRSGTKLVAPNVVHHAAAQAWHRTTSANLLAAHVPRETYLKIDLNTKVVPELSFTARTKKNGVAWAHGQAKGGRGMCQGQVPKWYKSGLGFRFGPEIRPKLFLQDSAQGAPVKEM